MLARNAWAANFAVGYCAAALVLLAFHVRESPESGVLAAVVGACRAGGGSRKLPRFAAPPPSPAFWSDQARPSRRALCTTRRWAR